MDMTDDKAEKKIDDKKILRTKLLSTKLSEAVKDMGGELLEVTEIEDVDGKDGKGVYIKPGKTEVRNQEDLVKGVYNLKDTLVRNHLSSRT